MTEQSEGKPRTYGDAFSETIGTKADRKLDARSNSTGVWFGLGMMGLVGWSVAAPTLIGAVAGGWLDIHYAGKHSWTLALLIAGLAIGCFNAWLWVLNQDKAMHGQKEKSDD